uniref:Uncharacterized protein n=1 Tax=Moumouvirus sp. 'Monve' TaxID=1128131 RepID=H2EFK4_9VIRU|nr:hypothetical protein mv_R1067 [Moumouvirus Monve]
MSKNKNSEKVYIKESTIPNSGKGLFAKTNIKINSVVGEFKGKLRENTSQIKILEVLFILMIILFLNVHQII